MLKKSRNSKYPPPPSPPKAEEILKDLETFNVELNVVPSRRERNNTDGQQQLDWWTRFEYAVADQESLKMLHSEIKNYKEKLESAKIELESEAASLEKGIKEQREKIDEVLEKESG